MVLTAGGITIVFLYVLQNFGGFSEMFASASSRHVPDPFALMPLPDPHGYLGYTGYVGVLYWIAAWLTNGLGSVATQDLMQRSMSARNEATSVWGSYVAAVLYFVFGVMSPLIGMMVHAKNPGIADEHLENLLVMTSQQYLPVALHVLFIAALTSALMSTSDSAILAGASVFTENVLPLFNKRVTDEQKLWWTRTMVVIIGTICIGIGFTIQETYRLAQLAWSLLLVGMFVPFAFGMYWLKANGRGAVSSICGGLFTWLIVSTYYYHVHTADKNTVADELDFENAAFDAVYIGSPPALLVALALMIGVSLLTQKRNPPLPLTDVDGQPLPMKNRLGVIPFRDIFRHE
jgi:Na+/proline symporter